MTRDRFQTTLSGVLIWPLFAVGVAAAVDATSEPQSEKASTMQTDLAFGQDVEFLSGHIETIVLRGMRGQAQVAVVPAYQGRVMTSTAGGAGGTSYGWINYDQVAKGVDANAQINVFGGEERFWLGPEGGQYSIFFAPAAEFEFSNWQTPPLIDTEPFEVVERGDASVTFQKDASLTNYAKSVLQLRISRQVELLSNESAAQSLDVDVEGTQFVGYRTINRLSNSGESDWKKENGLLSIWILGMYKPGPRTTVVIPFRSGSENELGPIVNDAYFGKVPADRLKLSDKVMYFSGDGTYRSKIGIVPQRSTGICGSYDAKRNVLTIVKYNQPAAHVTDYVNSMWELQEQPFAGDAINAYNDGPPEPGAAPLGPFYELETSSPALALKAGESATHIQETYHFEGSQADLNRLSQTLLGVTLQEIESAFR